MTKIQKNLDITDQKLLYELDLKSDASFQGLADKIKIPKETVAFRVKRLTANGFIKNFRTTVHISRLGYYYYKFFFKFQKATQQKEEEITNYLKHHKSIAYLAGLEGRYDVTFLVIARNLEDLQQFLQPFKAKFGEYILEQEILTLTQVNRFNFRFFYDGGKVQRDTYPEDLQQTNIDDIDHLIIKRLAQNARENLSAIARQAKTHVNVVRYRIEKLKKTGILGAPVLDINFGKFGVEHYQVVFTLKSQTVVESIIKHATTIPESTFASTLLGKYDLVLEFAVAHNTRLKEIINNIRNTFAGDVISNDIFVLHEEIVNWYPEKSPR
ncbi:MAG: winged helix-turn-helix transcriptional regulator [Patescibacteria group bacterium]